MSVRKPWGCSCSQARLRCSQAISSPGLPSARGLTLHSGCAGDLGFITCVRNWDKKVGGQVSPGCVRDSLLLQGLPHPGPQDDHELLPHLGSYFLKSISAALQGA